jgi:hypothetical protein
MTTYPVAEAHFFGGKALNTGKYQITFVPYPSNPTADSNSNTLNFSVLENNSNIYNVYSSLTIAKKDTGDIIAQYPYKPYEFSDITIPFAFNETGENIQLRFKQELSRPKISSSASEGKL